MLYVALLDALDLSDVTVVGNSVGGWVAAELALLGSPRIRDIVRDVKLFSRPHDDATTAVDVRRVLDSSTRMAWNERVSVCAPPTSTT